MIVNPQIFNILISNFQPQNVSKHIDFDTVEEILRLNITVNQSKKLKDKLAIHQIFGYERKVKTFGKNA